MISILSHLQSEVRGSSSLMAATLKFWLLISQKSMHLLGKVRSLFQWLIQTRNIAYITTSCPTFPSFRLFVVCGWFLFVTVWLSPFWLVQKGYRRCGMSVFWLSPFWLVQNGCPVVVCRLSGLSPFWPSPFHFAAVLTLLRIPLTAYLWRHRMYCKTTLLSLYTHYQFRTIDKLRLIFTNNLKPTLVFRVEKRVIYIHLRIAVGFQTTNKNWEICRL